MNKFFSYFIVILLIVFTFISGVYFSKDIYFILSKLDKNIKNFEKTDLGNFVKEATKEVFNPDPLSVNNPYKDVTLNSVEIFKETNIQRNINNLLPLYRNDVLDKSALAKANDMFAKQYFEHNSPSGVTPADLVKNYRYSYIVTGENLILGNFASEKDLVQAWMNSSGHRANILNNRYTEIGLAIVKGVYKGETTWIGVQEFGLPLSACKQPDVDLKNKIDQQKSQLDSLSLQIDNKRQEVNASVSDYKKYNELVEVYNNLVKQYDNLAESVKNLIAQYNNQVSVFNNCVAGNE